jgi:hypothetical protein
MYVMSDCRSRGGRKAPPSGAVLAAPDPTADNLHGGINTALVIGAGMVAFLAIILNHFVASHATARAVTATH